MPERNKGQRLATEPNRKVIISSTCNAAERSFVRSRGFVRRLYRLRSERLLAALLPFIQLLFFFCFLGPVALCALEAVICSECHAPFAAVSDDTLRSEQHVR